MAIVLVKAYFNTLEQKGYRTSIFTAAQASVFLYFRIGTDDRSPPFGIDSPFEKVQNHIHEIEGAVFSRKKSDGSGKKKRKAGRPSNSLPMRKEPTPCFKTKSNNDKIFFLFHSFTGLPRCDCIAGSMHCKEKIDFKHTHACISVSLHIPFPELNAMMQITTEKLQMKALAENSTAECFQRGEIPNRPACLLCERCQRKNATNARRQTSSVREV